METIATVRRESNPDEIARLMRGDGSATSRAPSEGLPGDGLMRAPCPSATTQLLTQLDDGTGRWQASCLCPRCGSMRGWIGSLVGAQHLIAAHQEHVAECRGAVAGAQP